MIEKDNEGSYHVRCNMCDKVLEGDYTGVGYARAWALRNGWRAVVDAKGERHYCPECAAKREQ